MVSSPEQINKERKKKTKRQNSNDIIIIIIINNILREGLQSPNGGFQEGPPK